MARAPPGQACLPAAEAGRGPVRTGTSSPGGSTRTAASATRTCTPAAPARRRGRPTRSWSAGADGPAIGYLRSRRRSSRTVRSAGRPAGRPAHSSQNDLERPVCGSGHPVSIRNDSSRSRVCLPRSDERDWLRDVRSVSSRQVVNRELAARALKRAPRSSRPPSSTAQAPPSAVRRRGRRLARRRAGGPVPRVPRRPRYQRVSRRRSGAGSGLCQWWRADCGA